MFSNILIHDKQSSSLGDKAIISIHDNRPDFSTRDVVIRRLFVRLSKIFSRDGFMSVLLTSKLGSLVNLPQECRFSELGLAVRFGTD
jgi:hypothetical protein